VEVEASQDMARELGVSEELSFGESFSAIREAVRIKEEWRARFDAAEEAACARETLPEPESMTDGDGAMVVDEESVLSGNKKGKGRELPRKEHVKKTPVVEVSIPVVSPVRTMFVQTGPGLMSL
jgi:hypothetical protein